MSLKMDKSISLHQQLRENSQSLENEFFDLKYWEEEMKKTDRELQSANSNQSEQLPPIRKKKNLSRQKPKTKDNGNKSKRIKSHEYSSWDKFDADKACEEIDKENESEESGEEKILTEEELEKNHTEALKQKVMGNKFVQEEKWDKAMACYSEAIKLFPYDAVFFANRALCHLKMDNLYSTEADCTTAVQLDGFYVKAYHRRATARMELKHYAEAIDDLKQVLKLEKNNKQAQNLLNTAQKALEKSKSRNDLKTIIPETKVDAENRENIPPKVDQQAEVESEILKTLVQENSRITKDWLFHVVDDVGEDVDVVKVIKKPPHQRSKKPLKSIPIVDKYLTRVCEKETSVEDDNKSKAVDETNDQKISITEAPTEMPPVPRCSIEFLGTWTEYKSPDFRYEYLKRVPPESIPKIFKASMDSEIFNDILSVLSGHFIENKDPVFDYVKFMSDINGFRMLTIFMGPTEIKNLTALFEYSKTVEKQPDEIIERIRAKYEM